MGGSPKTTTDVVNKTATTTPYQPAQGGLDAMLAAAQSAYNATPKTASFTGPNQDQTDAVNYLRSNAGATSTGVDGLRQLATDELAGKYLDPATNPYITGAVNAALNPIQQTLNKNILSISDAAQAAGAYGGDRSQLLKSTALNDWQTNSADTSANIYYQNYVNERNLQQGAGGLLSQANTLALEPAKILSSIGDQEQSWNMAQIAAAQQAPWQGLSQWQSALGAAQPYSSTTTQGTDTSTASAAGGGVGGALSGAVGGASAGSAFGPWGAAIGGVVGGLGGLFG